MGPVVLRLSLSVEKASVMFRSLCVESTCRALCSKMRWSLVGVALLCSACAAPQAPSGLAGPQPPPATATYIGTWKLQVEADGLPAQHAPRHRATTTDDLSEPWSPNYGRGPVRVDTPPAVPAAPAAPEPKAERAAQAPLPAKALAARQIASLDAEELIRRAIAAHEMRRPD